MNNNTLIIAAAGSGKTTHIINEALKIKNEKVLITTYTQANDEEIRKKFYKEHKCIPDNITVNTWFSFLIQHGVKPYQGYLYEKDVRGLILVNDQSAKRTKEIDIQRHYFTTSQKIYSDKISKFVMKCNEKGNGCVIDRISRLYSYIFIDEVQDLAGYDLEILKLFFRSKSTTILVGDPRQGTYSTNTTAKNKKYRKSEIVSFFDKIPEEIEKNYSTLNVNYRCISQICDLSNKLYPNLSFSKSGNNNYIGHDGVFLVKPSDVENYLRRYNPVQLRDSRRTQVHPDYQAMNFGESKGLSFDRVLLYPTKPYCDWLKNNQSVLAPTSRSKFYVAITRARYSVGIVYDFDDNTNIEGINKYYQY